MSRTAFYSLCGAALALALAFRLVGLDARPMHHDEANQAVKFGVLLETGQYLYDRTDHHGPTLYYLTLPSAWLRGQTTLASLDERTLRVVPALFGAGLILLLLFLTRHLGRGAVAAAALLAAVSPALTYYSRFYIQESIFVFFTVGFLIALGRYAGRPGLAPALWAGLFAGLAYATKETSVIVIASAAAACLLARPAERRDAGGREGGRRGGAGGFRWEHLGLGLTAALAVAFVFYSSFFRNPSGLLESILAFSTYLPRGVEAGRHAQPWDYYLRLLSWSSSGSLAWTEALILALALAGTVSAFRPGSSSFWSRYICVYSWLAALAFSLLRYKTPWNLLPFHLGFVLLAGVGSVAIARTSFDFARGRQYSLLRDWLPPVLAVVVLGAGSAHLAVQSWRANFKYGADPRNPYVYAHTSTDFLRLVNRIEDVAAVHPLRSGMLVKVVAGPYEQWPLPWYLREMTSVGYWSRAADAARLDAAPVVVASQEQAAAVEAVLGDRYVSEFYGLRPDVLLSVYIERGLWERFLETKAQLGSGDMSRLGWPCLPTPTRPPLLSAVRVGRLRVAARPFDPRGPQQAALHHLARLRHIEIGRGVAECRVEHAAFAVELLPRHRHHGTLDPRCRLRGRPAKGGGRQHLDVWIDEHVVLLRTHPEVAQPAGDWIVPPREGHLVVEDPARVRRPRPAHHELVVRVGAERVGKPAVPSRHARAGPNRLEQPFLLVGRQLPHRPGLNYKGQALHLPGVSV